MKKRYYEVVFTKVESVFVELSEQDIEESDLELDELAAIAAEYEVSDTDLIENTRVQELTSEYLIDSTKRHANHVSLSKESNIE
jgi:hypothetical protein